MPFPQPQQTGAGTHPVGVGEPGASVSDQCLVLLEDSGQPKRVPEVRRKQALAPPLPASWPRATGSPAFIPQRNPATSSLSLLARAVSGCYPGRQITRAERENEQCCPNSPVNIFSTQAVKNMLLSCFCVSFQFGTGMVPSVVFSSSHFLAL